MVDKKKLNKSLRRAKKIEKEEKTLRSVEQLKEEDKSFKAALKRLKSLFNRKRK